MPEIADNLLDVKNSLPTHVSLVAVSKTKPNDLIMEAYEAGQRIFGENRPREMQSKAEELPEDIQWHFIGHLQSNKVKYIAPFVALIHSVDKLSLLKEINKRARQNERTIDVLLQMYIAREESKFGMDEQEAIDLLSSEAFSTLKNIRVTGVMGMATNTDNQSVVKSEFNSLHAIYTALKERFFQDESSFKEISMGMSGDYQLAIEEGSTMVRVGSAIFGKRS